MGFSEYFEEEIEILEMKIDNLQEENKRLVGLSLDKDERIECLKGLVQDLSARNLRLEALASKPRQSPIHDNY